MGLVLGPHARTDRTRDTQVAEPWLPAPEDGRPREGQRLTPEAPHNHGRPPSPGTAPHGPRGTQPPQGMQAKGTALGPHTHKPARTERGWRTPTARPVGGQSGEGQRLTSDAPHNGGRQPFRQPHSEQRRLARAHAVGPVLGPHIPQQPHPGHTGRGTLAARSRGRAAGGGTAPDTRRPSQWLKAPPGAAPPPSPQRATPARKGARCGPVLGPHARTNRTRDTRVAEPRLTAPEGGRLGEGQRLTPDAPRNGGRPPPRGAAPHLPRGTQLPPGMRAEGTVPGPHTRTPAPTACGLWTPTARPEGGRSGEGQRLVPDAPHNSGRPAPRGQPRAPPRSTAPPRYAGRGDSAGPPHPHTRAHGKHGDGPTARPEGEQSGQGERLTADAPHNGPRTRTPVPTALGQRAPTPPGRRAAGEGRAPGLGRPSQRDRHRREHLVPTRMHKRRPAEPAYELPRPRLASPTARAPATGNPHPTPCS